MITVVLQKLIHCLKWQNEAICNGEDIARELRTERKVLKRLLEAYGFIVDIQDHDSIVHTVTVIVDKDPDTFQSLFEAAGFAGNDNRFVYTLD